MSETQVTYGQLAAQASITARGYLTAAIETIDDLMGDGAARENPALVTAVMQAATADYLAAMFSHRVAPALSEIAVELRELTGAVDRARDK